MILLINIGTILGRLVVAAGILIAIFSFINPEAVMKIMTFGGDFFMSILLAVLLIGSIFAVMGPTMMEMKKNERLIEKGKLTKSRILKVQKSLYSTGGMTYIKLTVQTMNGNEASCMLFVPKKKIPNVGDDMQILYDPENPKVISAVPTDTSDEN